MRTRLGAFLLGLWVMAAASCAVAGVSNYVIVVSVDGLGSPYLQSLMAGGQLPNFSRLQDEGAWTLNARNDTDYTVTLPNHTCIVTARGVLGDAGHGWTGNVDPPAGATIHANKGAYVSSVFDVAHDAGLRTGLYAGKSKFSLLQASYPDKIDGYVYNPTTSSLVGSYIAAMNANPYNCSLLHIKDPDAAGSWGSTAYNNAVRAADGYIGDVLSMISGSAALAGHTTLIVTADHGGAGNDHSDNTARLDYTIPFFAWGEGVSAGQDLYAINPTRLDPGTSRPLYGAGVQPIRNSDSSNLSLSLLGLGAIPGSMVNTAQDLRLQGSAPSPAGTVAYCAFNESAIGLTAWTPGAGNTELGFSTTVVNGPYTASGTALGTYDSISSPRRFRMMGYEAKTTFAPVTLAAEDRTTVGIDILIKSTTYEFDDYFRAVITNGTDRITLADVSGDALNAMPKLTFVNYSAQVPYSWTQATLEISSRTNSSTNAEGVDFDDIFFTASALGAADIDAVYRHFGPGSPTYDVNGDGTVNQADVTELLCSRMQRDYGDANLDGLVDFLDFQAMLDNWQESSTTWSAADFTGDQVVDFLDFQVLLDHWNPTGVAPASVPEPAAATLMVIAAALGLSRQNRP